MFDDYPIMEADLPEGVQMLLLHPQEDGIVNVFALMEDGSVMEITVPVCNLTDLVTEGNFLNPGMLDYEA